eukprot:6686241-Pyramimonas_sp.AAC.1
MTEGEHVEAALDVVAAPQKRLPILQGRNVVLPAHGEQPDVAVDWPLHAVARDHVNDRPEPEWRAGLGRPPSPPRAPR